VQALSSQITEKIISHIEIVIDRYLKKAEKRPLSNSGNPFIMALLKDFEPLIHRIHGMKTSMGNEMEKIAEIIAIEKWGIENVQRKVNITVRLPKNVFSEIDKIINSLSNVETLSDYHSEKSRVLLECGKPSSVYEEYIYEFDLIINDLKGNYFVLEMKGPDPNTTEVPGVKKRLLTALAWVYLNKSHNVDSRLCIYYNNKSPKPYKNPKVLNYFNPNGGLLIDSTFWNFIGKNENTYNELINTFEEFGAKNKKRIWDSLSKLIVKGASNE